MKGRYESSVSGLVHSRVVVLPEFRPITSKNQELILYRTDNGYSLIDNYGNINSLKSNQKRIRGELGQTAIWEHADHVSPIRDRNAMGLTRGKSNTSPAMTTADWVNNKRKDRGSHFGIRDRGFYYGQQELPLLLEFDQKKSIRQVFKRPFTLREVISRDKMLEFVSEESIVERFDKAISYFTEIVQTQFIEANYIRVKDAVLALDTIKLQQRLTIYVNNIYFEAKTFKEFDKIVTEALTTIQGAHHILFLFICRPNEL